MTAPVASTLGRRIAECRERLGWTQKTLAEKARLSVTFLSEVENDRRTPGTEALLSIAEALGASLDYLVKGISEIAPESRPLVVPPALARAADRHGWSLGEVSDILKFKGMVFARRSRAGQVDTSGQSLTEGDWERLHRRFFGMNDDASAES